MKRILCIAGAICLSLLCASLAYSWEEISGWGPGNELKLQGYKYHYFPISYSSATVAEVGGDAQSLGCVGLDTGATEIGSTQGYVTMSDVGDILRFRFRLPETFVDTGNQEDLILQFHLEEGASNDAITYDVNIYEYGSTSAIFTDTITLVNGDAKQWYNLDTYAAGIGDDSDIDGDDVLVIEISPQNNLIKDTADFYAVRLKYRAGILATE